MPDLLTGLSGNGYVRRTAHDERQRIGCVSFDPEFTRSQWGIGASVWYHLRRHIGFERHCVRRVNGTEGDLTALYFSLEDGILQRALLHHFA